MSFKIDIHVHASLNKTNKEINGEKLVSCVELKTLMSKLGIEKAVLMSSSEKDGELMSNKEVSLIVEKYPETYNWFCNIDPHNTNNIEDRLKKYKDMGAKGVGEFTTNLRMDNALIEKVFEACQNLDMPVLFHMSPIENKYYGVVDDPGLPLLEKTLKKYSDLKLIGHSQAFWYEMGKNPDPNPEKRNSYPKEKIVAEGRIPELFRKYNNLYGDLSANSGANALMRDPEFGYKFIEEFQDRLFFGTDMFTLNSIRPLSDWLDTAVKEGKITQVAYNKICRENIENLILR